jgi:hypothetical protein
VPNHTTKPTCHKIQKLRMLMAPPLRQQATRPTARPRLRTTAITCV